MINTKCTVNVEIDWRLGYGNMPSIHITTSTKENIKCSYFKKAIGNSWVYYGTSPQFPGLVDYFSYVPSNPTGSYGNKKVVVMKDGTIDEVTGVWSSRASAINKIVKDSKFHIVDVDVDFWAVGITVERLKELLPNDVELVLSDELCGMDEPLYIVVPKPTHKLFSKIISEKPSLMLSMKPVTCEMCEARGSRCSYDSERGICDILS